MLVKQIITLKLIFHNVITYTFISTIKVYFDPH